MRLLSCRVRRGAKLDVPSDEESEVQSELAGKTQKNPIEISDLDEETKGQGSV